MRAVHVAIAVAIIAMTRSWSDSKPKKKKLRKTFTNLWKAYKIQNKNIVWPHDPIKQKQLLKECSPFADPDFRLQA